MSNRQVNAFVAYLAGLAERGDRAALANLRRGLGRSPGQAPDMFRYVVPWIPADATRWQELAYYLVACLFALHPQPGGRGNLGSHLRVLLSRGASSDTVERRFTALLAAHPDDLATHLRHAVSLLRGANIPINWEQLFWDVWNWHDPERREHVLKDWARAYWGAESKDRGGLPCL